MQKIRRPRLVERAYPDGTEVFGPFAMPLGLSAFSIHIGRCTSASPNIWPDPESTIEVTIQTSLDGGNTFNGPSISVGPLRGGIQLSRGGVERAEAVATLAASDGDQVTHARGIVVFSSPSQPIRTYVDTEMNE